MKLTYFIPIFSWGENSESVHNNTSGTSMYSNLEDLYAFEENVVGYYEVNGIMPTKKEFEESLRDHN